MSRGRFQFIREGIVHHVIHGQLSDGAASTFLWLLLRCYRGVVWESAASLAEDRRRPLSTMKKHLRELKKKGYVVEFRQRASRGKFPMLIHKYEIKSGDRYYRLDAQASTGWEENKLAWVEVADDGTGTGTPSGSGQGPGGGPGSGTPRGTPAGTSGGTSAGTPVITTTTPSTPDTSTTERACARRVMEYLNWLGGGLKYSADGPDGRYLLERLAEGATEEDCMRAIEGAVGSGVEIAPRTVFTTHAFAELHAHRLSPAWKRTGESRLEAAQERAADLTPPPADDVDEEMELAS